MEHMGERCRELEHRLAERNAELEHLRAEHAILTQDNARLSKDLQERNAELTEALEQQTATAEILRVICNSPTDIQLVLDAVAESAARLCDASDVVIRRVDGDVMRVVAHLGSVPIVEAAIAPHISRDSIVGRTILERRTIHVDDVLAPNLQDEYPAALHHLFEEVPFRTVLGAPLVREGTAIGVITMRRPNVRPFTDKQIKLLETFAAQAVIAIENVRLVKELQARNGELTASLEQQTAMAEILRIISSSPTDTQPVFDAIASSGIRLFRGTSVGLRLVKDDQLERVGFAMSSDSAVVDDFMRLPRPVDDRGFPGRAVLRNEVIHAADVFEEDWVSEETRELARRMGWRACAAAPLTREGKALGAIIVNRGEPVDFTSKDIELLKTFADQAVIAIENVRLFKELQTRNAELTQSLERQTATSEVLKIISRSTFDLAPVLQALVDNAARLCRANRGVLFRQDGEVYPLAASYNATSELLLFNQTNATVVPGRGSISGRAISERQAVHVADVLADPDYQWSEAARVGNYRTVLGVPLLREGIPIGVMGMTRDRVEPFTDQEIALVTTFADQAVIAIENVRLFTELQASNRDLTIALERQTASSEILRVISRSQTDIQPVMDTIADSARRLCGGVQSWVVRYDGKLSYLVAHSNVSPEVADYWREEFRVFTPRPGLITTRAIFTGEVAHVPDVEADSDYEHVTARRAGYRSALGVPLLKDGRAIGAVAVSRREPGPFPETQIQLLHTFADQAVIAIENVRMFKELQVRNADLAEALDQQTAISEILRVMSDSPTDVQPVLDTVVSRSARICEANDVRVWLVDGDLLRYAAGFGVIPGLDVGDTRPLNRDWSLGRAVADRVPVQIADTSSAESRKEFPLGHAYTERFGARTVFAVPLLREGSAIGGILLRRLEPRIFTQKQAALLKTFADQAVIAIENVRLFKELEARNTELTESLEQQTATAEILQVISSSPTDIQPVLDAVAESAARLCEANDVVIRRVEEGMLRAVAHIGSVPLVGGAIDIPINNQWVGGRAVLERRTIHLDDVTSAQTREQYSQGLWTLYEDAYRTMLVVPLLREDAAIGTIVLRRPEVRPFSDKQIKLLETFAAQAVIAIENVRLFKELEARNAELAESLEQQTATAEILGVIAGSPTDAQPVLDTVIRSAVTLAGAKQGHIRLLDGEFLRVVAHHNESPEHWEELRSKPLHISESRLGLAIAERKVLHILDARAETHGTGRSLVDAMGIRTILHVPLLREGMAIGGLVIWRDVVELFSERQVDLVKSFADQAVIAIENVRLFKELQARNAQITEALEQQTATSEVLKVISRSTFDLKPVLETLVENARKLCNADAAHISRRDKDGNYLPVVHSNPQLMAYIRNHPITPDRGSALGRAIIDRRPVHIPDVLADSGYVRRDLIEAAQYRTILAVPMLREGDPVGVFILIRRKQSRPFTDKQIEVVTTFADQAVIAIENVRLFNEIQDKSRQLEIANRHKSEFLANMSHELRTPLNAVIGFSEVLQQGMVGEMNDKQGEYIEYIHKSGSHLLSLINDILDLSKVEAGRMELELTDFSVPLAIDNALTLVKERAIRHGLTLDCTLDPAVAEIHADERKFKQIMLNLLSNAVKFTPEGGKITVAARPVDGMVEVSVTDTGIGIAPEDRDAVFEEFRQVGTHAQGKAQGTGLGLALTKKFIELHGGRIWLTSTPGKGSTFSFTLPITQPAVQATA